jgi:hypothetical protein
MTHKTGCRIDITARLTVSYRTMARLNQIARRKRITVEDAALLAIRRGLSAYPTPPKPRSR